MAAIDDFKSAIETKIATISNTLVKAKATYELEGYIDAIQKQAALSDSRLQSYTIAGRTITRRNLKEGQDIIDALEAKLRRMIFGGISLVDMNTNVAEP